MNWKHDMKLSDLDPGTPLEVVCKRCGLSRYEKQSELLQNKALKQAYLDEVEAALKCRNRHCKGSVRISLIYDDKTEGFVGGMA